MTGVNRFLRVVALSALFSGMFFPCANAFATSSLHTTPRSLLYVTNAKSALVSLRAHVGSMDIVAPQTYASTPAGKLLGTPNQEILKLARDSGAQVMPLVVNQDFSQNGMHSFLVSDAAQTRLIVALIKEAKDNGYIGYQYDFEHMFVTDKDLYSTFVAKSAPFFHLAGLQLSVAVAPRHSDIAAEYGAGSWNNWTGAFDYRSIGYYADFISVMAYDDSKSVGPAASLPWVEDVLAYTLERVPAEKVSLGVPFYAWVKNTKSGALDHIVGYPAVAQLIESGSYKQKGWSTTLGVPYVIYTKQGKTLAAWYEDQKSFEQKLSLVTENNLHGFSAWALGLEDPKIWDTLVVMRAPKSGLAFNR